MVGCSRQYFAHYERDANLEEKIIIIYCDFIICAFCDKSAVIKATMECSTSPVFLSLLLLLLLLLSPWVSSQEEFQLSESNQEQRGEKSLGSDGSGGEESFASPTLTIKGTVIPREEDLDEEERLLVSDYSDYAAPVDQAAGEGERGKKKFSLK